MNFVVALALVASVTAEEKADESYTKITTGQPCNSKKPKMGCAAGLRCGKFGGKAGEMLKGIQDLAKGMGAKGAASETGETCVDEKTCGEGNADASVECSATKT